MPRPLKIQFAREAFTLVEMLVATAVLSLIMVILVQVTNATTATWTYTTDKAGQFRAARDGFETMTRRLSQATLNTYLDYKLDSSGNPAAYERQSELRFVCGPMQTGTSRLDSGSLPVRPTHGVFFQGPFGFVGPKSSGDTSWENYSGRDSLLNTFGYFIEVNDDSASRPVFITPKLAPLRIRSRLMEFRERSGAFYLYQKTSGKPGMTASDIATMRGYSGFEWFRNTLATNSATNTCTYALAENIVALAILPKLSVQDAAALKTVAEAQRTTILAPKYFYHSAITGEAASAPAPIKASVNSKHQLPPILQVTIVAIDEKSAQRLNYRTVQDDPLKVRDATFLTTAANYQRDLLAVPGADAATQLTSLEGRLQAARLGYRIFTTNLLIKGAKWSKDQIN